MTTDDNRESLADAAAAWVPPWDRPKPPEAEAVVAPEAEPEVIATPEPEAGPEFDTASEPEREAASGPEVQAASGPEVQAASGPEVQAASGPEADPRPDSVDERPLPVADAVSEPPVSPQTPVAVEAEISADTRVPDVARETPADAESAGGDVNHAVGDGPERAPDGSGGPGAEPQHGAGLETSGASSVPSQKGRTRTEPEAAAPRRRRAKPAAKAEPEPDPVSLIDDAELRGALEAILLVVDEPVPEVMLSQVLEQPTERVTQMLYLLSGEYTDRGHGFDLRRVAGGWRLYTRPEYAAYVERFVLDGQSARLTQAALETLAVVAYKQPCSRSQVSAIRGVNCDGVMRTLVMRGLVEECGTESDSGAYLYKTTILFLEKLGLDSVAQLPPLAPFLPDNVEEIVIDA